MEAVDAIYGAIYDHIMERTTLYLSGEIRSRLKAAAQRRHTTEAAIVRDALAQYLVAEPRPAIRAVGRSTDGGVAHRIDEALKETGFGLR